MNRSASSLGHQPRGAWTFDREVTRIFDDMLARSIPQLATMRELVFDVGQPFVRPGTAVVDLGCSRGGSLASFVDAGSPTTHYVGVDVSRPMLAACATRFRDEIAAGTVEVLELDLHDHYPSPEASLTLAVLTLQFIRPEQRHLVLRNAFEHTVRGGALVVVEKVRGASPDVDALLTRLYDDLKRANGYTQDEIERKRSSLEGVMAPVTAGENVGLLRESGFAHVECFWRALNFAAWVAVKQ